MTDPERIARRSRGLAAELLRAGADEEPSAASVEKTLVALGVSSAVLSATSAAGAAAAAGGNASSAVSAGTAKAVSLSLLAKWVGIGVVSGVGLAGAAAVATAPQAARPAPVTHAAPPPGKAAPARAPLEVAEPAVAATEASSAEVAPPAVPLPRVAPSGAPSAASPPAIEVGVPLAAEVAYVDRARALLASGQAAQGLALLRGYEHDFPEARLLPEVLFLQLETLERLGRTAEARAAAQRLVEGFPKSPHASRARKLL